MKKIIMIFVMGFLLSPVCYGASPVGQVVFVKGEAQVTRQGAQKPLALQFNDEIFALDTLVTQKGELKILFNDETLLSLGANTKLLVTEHVYKPKQSFRNSLFNVIQGTVRAIVSKTGGQLKESKVTFETPTAVAGIRGTDLGIYVFKAGTQFVCFNGAFDAFSKKNPTQKVLVTTGHYTEIRHQDAPTNPTTLTPEVQKHFEMYFEDSTGDIMDQAGGDGVNDQKQKEEEAKVLGAQTGSPDSGKASSGGDSDQEQGTESGDVSGQDQTPGLPDGSDNNAPGDQAANPAGGSQVANPPQLLPGGANQPPAEAAGGSSAQGPVDVPIHFPDNGGNPQQQPVPQQPVAPVDIPINFPDNGQGQGQLPIQAQRQLPQGQNDNPRGP